MRHGVSYELTLRYRTSRRAAEKRRISEAVAGLIAVDTAVLGVDGFDPADGAATRHEDEASANRLLCARARRVVIAADSGKPGVRAFARNRTTQQVDVLVTDTGLPPAVAAAFGAQGVEVVRV